MANSKLNKIAVYLGRKCYDVVQPFHPTRVSSIMASRSESDTTTTTQSPILLPRAKEGDSPALPDTRKPPSNPSLEILHYQPDRYIVVLKPADVRMDGPFTHTVESLILAHLTGIKADAKAGFFPRFVHRLDYATSGVLLVALSKLSASVVATQFEKRQVRKEYVALVHGHISTVMEFEQRIADCPKGSFRMVVGTSSNPGRASRTECYPITTGTYHGTPVTKVKLVPCTGRRHQLRVHCAHAGYPIVGDATYSEKEAAFLPPRMMLHARLLELGLPVGALYGRKSALRNIQKMTFDGGDCFDGLEGLVLDHG